MKKFCLATIIPVILLFSTNGLMAQSAQSQLNQFELMEQFLGYWKCDIGKDTARFWDVRSYGTGFECSLTVVTRGIVILEGKRLWGYDKRADKYIGLELIKGIDMRIYAQWFTSEYKGIAIPYSDISNPEMAPITGEAEFKSPDMYIVTTIINIKTVKTDTYIRIKESI